MPPSGRGRTATTHFSSTAALPTLVDAGVGDARHVASLERALAGRPLRQVVITHAHPDHSSGVPALVARWGAVRVLKLPPAMPPSAEALADGDRIEAGDYGLVVVATPGHSPDHCCLFDERSGDLYCGDLVRAGGTIVIAASRGGDLAAYLGSLHRVRAMNPSRLLPGHGPAVDRPRELIDEYLRHRAERETQVISALRAGGRTPDAIAATIYAGLSPSLMRAARDTVLAHLIKLKNEGRADEKSGSWHSTA